MRERQDLEQLTNRVSRGLLASEMVVAMDHLLTTGDWNSDADRSTATQGKQLLEELSASHAVPTRPPRPRQMVASKSLLETMHAVRAQAPDEPVIEYLRRLAESISKALDDGLTPEIRADLEMVRDLFAYLAQVNLARVNEVTRSRRELPRWPSKTSSLF